MIVFDRKSERLGPAGMQFQIIITPKIWLLEYMAIIFVLRLRHDNSTRTEISVPGFYYAIFLAPNLDARNQERANLDKTSLKSKSTTLFESAKPNLLRIHHSNARTLRLQSWNHKGPTGLAPIKQKHQRLPGNTAPVI